MKIFISADMDGCAGVAVPRQCDMDNPDYELARHLMTDEVNAAIAGAFDAGAYASHYDGRRWAKVPLPAAPSCWGSVTENGLMLKRPKMLVVPSGHRIPAQKTSRKARLCRMAMMPSAAFHQGQRDS